MNNSISVVAIPVSGVVWAARQPFGVGALLCLWQKSGIQVNEIPSAFLGLDSAGDAWYLSRGQIARPCECESLGRFMLALHFADEAKKPGGEGIFLDVVDAGHAPGPLCSRALGQLA